MKSVEAPVDVKRRKMRRALKTILLIFVLFVLPLIVSYFSPLLVPQLMKYGVIHDLSISEYIKVATLCTDLSLQVAYFSAVAFFIGRFYPLVLEVLFTGFTMLMFLRYGAATLHDSMVGSISYFGP